MKCEQKSFPDERLSLPVFGSPGLFPLGMEVMGTQVYVEVPEDRSQLGIVNIPGRHPYHGRFHVREKEIPSFFLKPLSLVGCLLLWHNLAFAD